MLYFIRVISVVFIGNNLCNWISCTIAEIEIAPVFTHHYHYTLSILPNRTTNIIKQKWNQFLLVVKATALKQQISKFYPQIPSIDAFTFMTGHWQTQMWSLASVRWICILFYNCHVLAMIGAQGAYTLLSLYTFYSRITNKPIVINH